MKKIRIGILGAQGRMGKELTSLLSSPLFPNLILQKAFISPHSAESSGYEHLSLKGLGEVDVLIDFSEPLALLQAIPLIQELKTPLVIGTTGFSSVQKEEIQKLGKKVPIVFAPNTSIGVNTLIKLIGEAASLLSDFDISIVETHHKDKKDAPSGTALKLKHHLEKVKSGLSVPIQSIRGGNVIGKHEVLFLGMGEHLALTHVAASRDIFAKGALQAALWVKLQKPGIYSMQDVLEKTI